MALHRLLGGALALALLLELAPPARGNGPESEAPAATDAAAARASCAERVARRVQRHYETVRDLEARFEQRTERVALGGQPSQAFVARGHVQFAKPGRMRWSYEEPEPSLVVSDGESMWIYDPAAREAQHLPLGEQFLSGAAIQFLLGRGDLLREFRVSAASCEAPVRLVLVPRTEAPYERLEVRVDPESGEVRETAVVDLLGNVTRIGFEQVRTNQDPDPARFRFTPEPGVRVLELPRSGTGPDAR